MQRRNVKESIAELSSALWFRQLRFGMGLDHLVMKVHRILRVFRSEAVVL
jgi:hypothetical protein